MGRNKFLLILLLLVLKYSSLSINGADDISGEPKHYNNKQSPIKPWNPYGNNVPHNKINSVYHNHTPTIPPNYYNRVNYGENYIGNNAPFYGHPHQRPNCYPYNIDGNSFANPNPFIFPMNHFPSIPTPLKEVREAKVEVEERPTKFNDKNPQPKTRLGNSKLDLKEEPTKKIKGNDPESPLSSEKNQNLMDYPNQDKIAVMAFIKRSNSLNKTIAAMGRRVEEIKGYLKLLEEDLETVGGSAKKMEVLFNELKKTKPRKIGKKKGKKSNKASIKGSFTNNEK